MRWSFDLGLACKRLFLEIAGVVVLTEAVQVADFGQYYY